MPVVIEKEYPKYNRKIIESLEDVVYDLSTFCPIVRVDFEIQLVLLDQFLEHYCYHSAKILVR